MKIISEAIRKNGAILTGYIQEAAIETAYLNTCPAILILPGGAFRHWEAQEMEAAAIHFYSEGCQAFVLRYTLIGDQSEKTVFAKALEDAEEAMSFIRKNALNLHVNPKQIAAVGFSVGGNLAAALGTMAKEKPNAIVLAYAMPDGEAAYTHKTEMPDLTKQISVDTPPTFLFAMQQDKVAHGKGTLKFAMALETAGVPYELHVFPNGSHGISVVNGMSEKNETDASLKKWPALCIDFLWKVWDGNLNAKEPAKNPGIDMKIGDLLKDARYSAIFDRCLPGIRKKMGGQPMTAQMTLRKLAEYAQGMISNESLLAVDEELRALDDLPEEERTTYDAFHPGKVWLDTNGKRIQAHGGAVFHEDGTYYWYGENKERTTPQNDIWTWGIRAYASKDLYNWEDMGLIIPPDTENPESNLNPRKFVDRPHILKCPSTGKYVCWIKISGPEACFVLLSADRFSGPYVVEENAFYPMGKKIGDFDLVQDEDGRAYLFTDCAHSGIYCMELTENYLDVKNIVTKQYEGLHAPFCREGVAVFSRNGKKYMFTSSMTGYIPNQSDEAVSDSWEEPFDSVGDPHVGDASKASFNSQISKVFQVQGRKDLYIAMADRWVPDYPVDAEKIDAIMRGIAHRYDPEKYPVTEEDSMILMNCPMIETADTSIADYVWLPIRFEGGKALIEWKDEWKIEDYEKK